MVRGACWCLLEDASVTLFAILALNDQDEDIQSSQNSQRLMFAGRSQTLSGARKMSEKVISEPKLEAKKLH